MTVKQAGLAGVVVGQTAIATVGQSGKGLSYRGYPIEALAEHAHFAEVAYLLIHGVLPNREQYDAYQQQLSHARPLPDALRQVLQAIPQTAHPMDVLRTACSFLGTLEPENHFSEAQHIADTLLARFPVMLLYWYHYHRQTLSEDLFASQPTALAAYFLQALRGKFPAEIEQRALDVSLTLYAEHEFNASTFAARVTTATLSDFYSAITTAIGTLRGPLHGGANEAALALLQRFSDVESAEKGILAMLASKEKIMGFGHRVYRESDPRSDIIKQWAERLSAATGQESLYAIAERIEQVMWREKQLFPNLDFYSAVVYHCCGIPVSFFTPLFVISRLSGWTAHILEQRANNRLIRPNAEYNGPSTQTYVELAAR